MGRTTYERGSGGHVAERVSPVPDSPEAADLERLADDPSTAWRRVPDEAPPSGTAKRKATPSPTE